MIDPNSKTRLRSVLISPKAPISEAIAKLDKAGSGALLLCSEDRCLAGLLTDGDIRRAILQGIPLGEPCEGIASQTPITAGPDVSAAEALRIMNLHDVNQLPLVDSGGVPVSLVLRRDLVAEDPGVSAVIMAGGFGRRLYPLTDKVPKPMLPVGDRPILERTIERLRMAGIHRVSLTTHYLADAIVNHFGDGEAFGVELEYVTEEHPLGTAGGLKLLKNIDQPLLVLNGDILTGVRYDHFLAYHRKHRADVTVGVRKYEMQVPFGVLECSDVRVTGLTEKPSFSFFINAGAYLLEPVVHEFIPEGRKFDMTDLIQRLLEAGRRVVSFPITEYWLDIGRHDDYQRAQEDALNGRIL
jgi:dTDP-glucose pyrophosphorylase